MNGHVDGERYNPNHGPHDTMLTHVLAICLCINSAWICFAENFHV